MCFSTAQPRSAIDNPLREAASPFRAPKHHAVASSRSRSTSRIGGSPKCRFYILSQQGDLVCFTTDGKEVWRVNYIKDFGGIMPVWGFAESPLIDGDKIICTPGAPDATLMALDKQTRKPIWKCAVPEGPSGNRGFLGTSGAAYASVIAIDFEGQRQYVQLTATTLVGVAATDGKLLWRYGGKKGDKSNFSGGGHILPVLTVARTLFAQTHDYLHS